LKLEKRVSLLRVYKSLDKCKVNGIGVVILIIIATPIIIIIIIKIIPKPKSHPSLRWISLSIFEKT